MMRSSIKIMALVLLTCLTLTACGNASTTGGTVSLSSSNNGEVAVSSEMKIDGDVDEFIADVDGTEVSGTLVTGSEASDLRDSHYGVDGFSEISVNGFVTTQSGSGQAFEYRISSGWIHVIPLSDSVWLYLSSASQDELYAFEAASSVSLVSDGFYAENSEDDFRDFSGFVENDSESAEEDVYENEWNNADWD